MQPLNACTNVWWTKEGDTMISMRWKENGQADDDDFIERKFWN